MTNGFPVPLVCGRAASVNDFEETSPQRLIYAPFLRSGPLPLGSHSFSPECDEALKFAQRLQPQFHSTEALRLLELGSRAKDHA